MTSVPSALQRVTWSPEIDKGFVYFDERQLDGIEDLSKSFKLRYQVYCEEMRFLRAEDYPDGMERDAFDAQSVHFGSFNKEGAIVGTVRLVRGTGTEGVPMYEHCHLYPEERKRIAAIPDVVEVSRLVVSRNYRRRAGDGLYGLSGMSEQTGAPPVASDRRQFVFPTVLRLYRVMYHALKRQGITHILASMEMSLFRILRAQRFPFHEIGPEADYYGPVRPFYLNLDELDRQFADGCSSLLHYFNYGLDLKRRVA